MRFRPFSTIASAAAILCSSIAAQAAQPSVPWFSTWAAPPVEAYPNTDFAGLTTRQTIHVSLGGSQVRLRISNLYGTVPLVIGAAHIATPTGADTITASTDTAFLFGGLASITIPPGAVALSDATTFTIKPNSNYMTSIYTPSKTGPITAHLTTSHFAYAATGNAVSSVTMPSEMLLSVGVFFISGLDVAGTTSMSGVVTVGDSITDGYGATFGTDTSWPNSLSTQLSAVYGNSIAVADAGTSSSRLLADYSATTIPSGLSRLDRDVFALPNVTHIILALGINDIGLGGTNASPSAADIIAGYQQFVARAHERNITVFGATITPAGGSVAYANSVFEAKRQAINTAIRAGGIFDTVVDFDAAIRNPSIPSQMLPAYDCGDHLHPSTAGYQVMAKTIVSSVQ